MEKVKSSEKIISRMKELGKLLNEASRAYYQESRELMPNLEYDRLYDELASLERESGIVLSGSPTTTVGYEVLSALPKEAHPEKMLSLDKTKDKEELAQWLGQKTGVLSWKLDGLTIVLTYEDGKLLKAVTRGNGEIGEVVTPNVRCFENVPLEIAYKGKLVLRGEAVIRYSDFEKLNEEIEESAKYKNPRNLCSGSVRQLNTEVTASRHVNFFAFSLVSAEGADFENSREKQFRWLEQQGFDVVERRMVCADENETAEVCGIRRAVEDFEHRIVQNDFPSDGLVLCYDDIAYGKALGTTAKFPRDSIAFKWEDETADTVLREIEWSASRTGLINPVAVFDPVDIEGTTVSRASVHNVSIVRELALGIGDTLSVYKANMIIPQIAENKTRSGTAKIPEHCPVCGGEAVIRRENDVETLVCINPGCLAKQIKSFTLFVSRDAMNIEGLSEATIEKLIAKGLIQEPADLFRIAEHREAIVQMEGFGEKSFENLAASVERARHTTAARLLYSLGIPGIGSANARLISRACGDDFARMEDISKEELLEIDGIGEIMAESYRAYFDHPDKRRMAEDIRAQVELEKRETPGTDSGKVSGKTFVITGSLRYYENRSALKTKIEDLGGKVVGSVSAKTDYLINNDSTSNSAKNKAAKELGIPILTERQLIVEIFEEDLAERSEREEE